MKQTIIELLPFVAVSMLGQLIHILLKLSKLEKMGEFSLKEWLQRNTFTTILGFVGAIGIVFWLNGKNYLDYSTAIAGGLIADSVFKTIAPAFKRTVKKMTNE